MTNIEIQTSLIQPELNLWSAVLERAIKDWHKLKYRWELRQYFTSPSRGIGSFLWICELLGFNPEQIRVRLGLKARG